MLLRAAVIQAQVPLVSLDLLAGAAAHNRSADGYEFADGLLPTIRLAATVRLGSRASTRPVLKVEFELRRPDMGSTGAGGPIAYPATGGVSYALGVRHVTPSGIGLGMALGGGRYGGSYRGSRHNSIFGEAELSRQIHTHAALAANAQYRQWVADGTRFWYSPITIGVHFF